MCDKNENSPARTPDSDAIENLFRAVNSHTQLYTDLHNSNVELTARINTLEQQIEALRATIDSLATALNRSK